MSSDPSAEWYVVMLGSRRSGDVPLLVHATSSDDADRKAWAWLRIKRLHWYVMDTMTLKEFRAKTATLEPLLESCILGGK